MGKVKLDLGEESSSADEGLKINKDYADKYEQWRSKEVLQKLKDKFKNKPVEEEDEDESSSESEPEWTAEDEKGFLRALGALKTKDPKIYDKTRKFFAEKSENEIQSSSSKKQQKSKKASSEKKGMTLRDYEIALVTERGGKFDDEDMPEEPQDEGYYKKNQRLKDEFKAIAMEDDDDESEDDEAGGFMKKRVKTVEEKEKEEDDYAEWLKGEGKDLNIPADDDIKKLKKVWDKPELDKDEQFLRDYLLEKKYDVDDDQNPDAPTYDDIVKDETEIEKADDFEHKYNFRFEEPDQDFIKQFPRTIKESVRKSSVRKEKREKKKKQKDDEQSDDDELNFVFKYRSVPANNYGLSTEEILEADDAQLNRWVSVKKASQYRSEKDEEYDRKVYEQKVKAGKKEKIFAKKNDDETKASANVKKIGGVDFNRLKAYNVSNKTLKRKIYQNSTANKKARKS